jgi:hypothetical protein
MDGRRYVAWGDERVTVVTKVQVGNGETARKWCWCSYGCRENIGSHVVKEGFGGCKGWWP